MGSQACSSLDALIRTRFPASSSGPTSILENVPPTESRKRKRDGEAMEDLLNDVFVVKPHPPTAFAKPQTLWPIALLLRSLLPLSCLDIISGGGPLPVSRLFEAHVRVLELERRLDSTPMVLIARSEDGKSHFAIERESTDVYAICKLGSWVKIDQLCEAALVSRYHSKIETINDIRRPSSAKGAKEEPVITAESSKYSKKKRLAIEAIQSMVKRPSRDAPANSQVTAMVPSKSETIIQLQLQESGNVIKAYDEIVTQPATADILENIRSQYFEALYLSKASLAYFAKGPLSRARAAFHLDYDSTLDMNDLVIFLESLVLPTSIVDKKFKVAVPNLVSTLIMGNGSADEAQTTTSRTKRAKFKKMKLSKTGLYPTEDTYITRWWNSHDASVEHPIPGETNEDTIRKRIEQLRIRETQLQMIVILETLALRPLVAFQVDLDENLPASGIENSTTQGRLAQASKPKKSPDLAVLVEVHVDRLCIWQSVAAEAGIVKSKTEGESKMGMTSGGVSGKHDNSCDMLRDFCVEVIVPFFSARLPEQCGTISRKLGGPLVISPVRSKPMKSSTTPIVTSRPGAVTKRPVPSKVRRSLQRVLTDERRERSGSRGPSGAISLMRSVTAPIAPGLKRESSESPLLENIPNTESQSLAVSRGGVLKTKKFSQREVDMSNLGPGNDPKSKKPNFEAELKEAILALKRPNRQLAGQSIVEMAERRTSSTSNNFRKSKKPIRNSSFQGVQILSTPKGNRRKEATLNTPPIPRLSVEQSDDMEAIPPSSLPRIPMSVTYPANSSGHDAVSLYQTTSLRTGHRATPVTAIQVTPCRSRPVLTSRLSTNLTAPSSQISDGIGLRSPSQARRPNKAHSQNRSVPSLEAVECTPIKGVAFQDTPVKLTKSRMPDEGRSPIQLTQELQATGAENTERKDDSDPCSRKVAGSIYETLGWDDYDLA